MGSLIKRGGVYFAKLRDLDGKLVRYSTKKRSPAQAGEEVIIKQVPALGGDGGAIILSADGRASTPFNTQGMYRGWIGADGVPHVAIFADEKLKLPGE